LKTISGYILTKVFGWKIRGEFPDIKKSIVIFAPHTSYFDALYGKLYLNEIGIRHKFLSKKELFFFPMNILMRLYGSIPVRGIKDKNSIFIVADLLKHTKSMHAVISPEGTIYRVNRWDMGYYYIAKLAKVPVIVGYIDYQKKEIGIKGVVYNLKDKDAVAEQISLMYNDITAKHPENFSPELIN
jgi:1-acyl-sn-glycerol-3-phosphate acyltransferase